MTSTIGIPIKLLNEAQGHIVTLEITSGQTYRGKLLEGAFYSKKYGWKFEFALTYSSSSSHSRGQYEHSAQGHHHHGARRARQPSRPGLHPWKPRAVLHRAGYVEVRSVNPQNPESRIQCFECMNANPASRSRNAPMFKSRNARGRGVGLARGRATVSRARASGRGGR